MNAIVVIEVCPKIHEKSSFWTVDSNLTLKRLAVNKLGGIKANSYSPKNSKA